MKKSLTLPTVIVLLLTILVAGGFSLPQDDDCVINDPDKVIIYVRASGGNHLEMYDSNDENGKVIDDLATCVLPGMKVVWRRATDSGIKKFTKVSPIEPIGDIFTEDAHTLILHKRYRYRIPDDAKPGRAEYEIELKDQENNIWGIDPYLEIPE